MRDEQSHLSERKLGKSLKHFEFAFCVERGRRLVQDQQLRIAQIGARQSNTLPLAAGLRSTPVSKRRPSIWS